jgi:hypothetical protein
MSGFRPTDRGRGTYSRVYDVMVVGDLDDDGRLRHAALGHRQRTMSPHLRHRTGRWAVGYHAAINGDLNGNGRRDEFVIVNVDNGSAIVNTSSMFIPVYRGNATFSSTFDLGLAADLDDDRRHDELLLFDRDAAQWQVYTYRNFDPVLARAGAWSVGYDVLRDGAWD